jgi:hypothetical protein
MIISGSNIKGANFSGTPEPSGNVAGSITILSSPISPTPVSWNLNPVPAGGNGALTMSVAGGVYVIRADSDASITLKMWGGGGGGAFGAVPTPPGSAVNMGSPGGGGGFTGGTWNLINNQVYTCVVGGGGTAISTPTYPQAAPGAGGGGASGIEIGNTPTGYGSNANIVIAVAGGGGGASIRTIGTATPYPAPITGTANNAVAVGGGGGGTTAGSGQIGGYGYLTGQALTPGPVATVYFGGGGYWDGAGTTTGNVTATPVAPGNPASGTAPSYYNPGSPALNNWGGLGVAGTTVIPGAAGGSGWAPGGSGGKNSTPGLTVWGAGGGGGGFRGGAGGGRAPPISPNSNAAGTAGGGGSGYYNTAHMAPGTATTTGEGGFPPSIPQSTIANTTVRPAANTSDPSYSPVNLWGQGGRGGRTSPSQSGNPGAIILSMP